MSLVTTLTGLNEKRCFNETVLFPFARIREPGLADQRAEIRANDRTAKLQILYSALNSVGVIQGKETSDRYFVPAC